MFGAMLSATDPVAVVAILKELGVSERLAILIEGESLLNDGTSIVLFSVFLDALTGVAGSDAGTIFRAAARLSLGGPLVGIVMGCVGTFALGYVIDDASTEITITIIVCFSAFLISEATNLRVSGVLAVVTTGLMMSYYARGRISPGVEESMHTFWSMLSYVANTGIFFIAGLIIGDRAIFSVYVDGSTWGYLIVLYLGLLLVRAVVVLLSSPVLIKGGYGMEWSQLLVLIWAGLRGAVGLTLALVVAEENVIDEEIRDLVLFYMAGIAALTILVNGTSIKHLLHYLGMDRGTAADTEIFVRACALIEAKLENRVDLLKADRFVGDADWATVWRYIPVLTPNVYWRRIRHSNVMLSTDECEDIIGSDPVATRHNQSFPNRALFWASQCLGWFKRRVFAGFAGGENYTHIPFRLRHTWYTYHQTFQVDSAIARDEVENARFESEMMQLKYSHWAGGLAGGGAAPEKSGSSPTSSSLKNKSRMAIAELRLSRERAVQEVKEAEDALTKQKRENRHRTSVAEENREPTSEVGLLTVHNAKQIKKILDASRRGLVDGRSMHGRSTHLPPQGPLALISQGSMAPQDTEREGRSLQEALEEARVRFLTAVKANLQELYQKGWVSSSGMRVLKVNVDVQLDHTDEPLQEWEQLAASFTLPAKPLAVLRRIPLLGTLVESFIYRRLAFIFELASNFISAHENVDILELIKEGPVAYQLAFEKNRQVNEARETLAHQLPVFPELARALKTQVAARYILGQHKEIVESVFAQGHINEREYEKLIHKNNTSRIKLDYHPITEQIPDRRELLRSVPFFRFLSNDQFEAIVGNTSACVEEFYGSNVVLMKESGSDIQGHRRAGWFVVVRGSVRQLSEGMLDHKTAHGSVRQRLLSRERLLPAGTVFGLEEQLLNVPYESTFSTASFVHLFFFDKSYMLSMAEQFLELKQGLWWSLALTELKSKGAMKGLTYRQVYQVMLDAEFVELSSHRDVDVLSNSQSSHMSKGPRLVSSSNMDRWTGGKLQVIRKGSASTALTESKHAARRMIKNLSRSRGLDETGHSRSPELSSAPVHRYVLNQGSGLLLLRGDMLSRIGTETIAPLEGMSAVKFIKDIEGPLEFTDGTIMFHLPPSIIARTASSHTVLMQDIQTAGKRLANRGSKTTSPKISPRRRMFQGIASPFSSGHGSARGRHKADEPIAMALPEGDAARRRMHERDEELAAKAPPIEHLDLSAHDDSQLSPTSGSFMQTRRSSSAGSGAFVRLVPQDQGCYDEDSPRGRMASSLYSRPVTGGGDEAVPESSWLDNDDSWFGEQSSEPVEGEHHRMEEENVVFSEDEEEDDDLDNEGHYF